ncbi:hypothetical protein [Photorhabdus africana]|uniref:hypothetical protein n=1 Tax=Photorhabdus africana TaxID=3097554 RepID=UPI002B415CB9|nr:hypothetical protein [Photorhabdus sp. CRI-LC]
MHRDGKGVNPREHSELCDRVSEYSQQRGNLKDNGYIGFVILQSDDIPDELRKILAEEMTAGLGARIAMKLTINPKIDRK